MINKILITLVISFQFLFINKLYSTEIQFNANEIEVLDEGNETIAKNGTAYIKKDKISIKGSTIRYIKNKSLLIIKEGEIKKIKDNLKITSGIIEYRIDQSNLYFRDGVKIHDNMNNLNITTDEINYSIEKI